MALMIIVNIDGDGELYKVGFSAAREEITDLPSVLHILDCNLSKILERTESTHYRGFLTDSPSNFRIKAAFTLPYKGNRNSEKPPFFKELREHVIDHWKFHDCVGIEADDAVIIAAHGDTVNGISSIVASPDKDSLQYAGKHYNSRTDESLVISDWQAKKNFAMQMITGDAVDNIRGLSGYHMQEGFKGIHRSFLYGKATAESMLSEVPNPDDFLAMVYSEYCDMHCWYDVLIGEPLGTTGCQRFHESMALLYMLREVPEGFPCEPLDLTLHESRCMIVDQGYDIDDTGFEDESEGLL